MSEQQSAAYRWEFFCGHVCEGGNECADECQECGERDLVRKTPALSAACEHDWRALREWETVEYPPAMPAGMTAVPIPQQSRTVHWIEWYCTKCRQIEATQR